MIRHSVVNLKRPNVLLYVSVVSPISSSPRGGGEFATQPNLHNRPFCSQKNKIYFVILGI